MTALALPITRIALKKILVATDFSRLSDRALDYAFSFARRYGSTVIAAHVVNPSLYATPSAATMYGGMDPLPYLDSVYRQLRHRLEEIVNNAKDGGVKCVPKLVEGNIAEQVRLLAEEIDADLIVLGTRGEERFERLIMGSVAESVVHSSKAPVLTVGPRVFRRPKLEASLKHIIYATDFSSDSVHAAPYAISLAEEFAAKITLVHVLPPELRQHQSQESLLTYFHGQLKKLVPAEAQFWCEPEFILEFGGSSEAIVNLAEERNADLIVLGTRKSSGVLTYFKSGVAYHVMCQAECPVFTVTGEREYTGRPTIEAITGVRGE
jgi:nucleotide-binding universal stress UspA family protein